MYREYFLSPYPERGRNADKTITVIDDSRVLNDILPDMGYRKEWDDKKYGKMLKRGKEMPIPSRILFRLNAILPEINSTI